MSTVSVPGAVGHLYVGPDTLHPSTLWSRVITGPSATLTRAGAFPSVVMVTSLPWGPVAKSTILGKVPLL